MARFLPAIRDLFGGPLETKAHGLGGLPFASSSRTWGTTRVGDRTAGWDMEAVVAEGYERSIWVYRCVELFSGQQSRLPFRIGRNVGEKDAHVLTDHPLYRVLNKRANPLETGRQFRKRLSAQVLLSKKGAFIEVTKSAAGIITRLDLLDPGRVEVIASDNGEYIDHFQYTRLDGRVEEIEPERVRWVREPHPTDPFSGTTPLEAAGISVELDQLSRIYNISFIKNDSRPGGILAVDTETMTDQEMARLETRFKGGAHSAGELSVVASGPGGIKYVDTTTRPRDMAYAETTKNSKEEILAAFGIGESLLGNAAGRTFDNAEQEEYNFWTKPMPPHLDLIGGAFADDISGDEYEPFFDTSSVEVLELPLRRRREEARIEVREGLRSVDEYRPLSDLPTIGIPQSRALWLTPNRAPLPAIPADEAALLGGEGMGEPGMEGQEAPQQTQSAGEAVDAARELNAEDAEDDTPLGPASQVVRDIIDSADDSVVTGSATEAVAAAREPVPMPWLEDDEPTGEEELDPVEELSATDSVTAAMETKALVGAEPSPDLARAGETALTAALAPLMARQQGVITARITSPKRRRGTQFWVPVNDEDTRAGDEPIDVAAAVDPERWATEAAQNVSLPVQTTAQDAAEALLASLVAAGVLSAMPSGPDMTRWVSGATRMLTLTVISTIAEAITDLLEDLIEHVDLAQAGATEVEELVAAIEDFYAARAPRLVAALAGDYAHALVVGATDAVLEAVAAQHAEAIDDGEVTIEREWVSRRDERVRPTHRAVDGTVLPVGERFQVGTALMLYPQEPTAPPQERYGCRCRLRYHVNTPEPLTFTTQEGAL